MPSIAMLCKNWPEGQPAATRFCRTVKSVLICGVEVALATVRPEPLIALTLVTVPGLLTTPEQLIPPAEFTDVIYAPGPQAALMRICSTVGSVPITGVDVPLVTVRPDPLAAVMPVTLPAVDCVVPSWKIRLPPLFFVIVMLPLTSSGRSALTSQCPRNRYS